MPRGKRRDELPPSRMALASGALGASVVEASKKRDAKIGTERANMSGRRASIVRCRGGAALEIGHELVTAETRRNRIWLHEGHIGKAVDQTEVRGGAFYARFTD